MHLLVVGGTGAIGGHAALYLQSLGHKVTISGRNPSSVPLLAALPFIKGNYLANDIPEAQLATFDAVIFTAGADGRHVPNDEDPDAFLLRANGVAVPDFAALARSAGVKQFIHVGSIYPHVVPDKVGEVPYILSRKLASDGVAALSTPAFSACSIDAPIVVGIVPGMRVSFFEAYVRYAEGKIPVPPSAPIGGMNFISGQSLSEAIAGALQNGAQVAGRSFAVGDENFTYAEYMSKFFSAVAGKRIEIEAREGEHPLMPSYALFAGNEVVEYEPAKEDVKLLGSYRRGDIDRAVAEIVREYRSA
ncbi:hypothetical protein HJFPF1_02349 [Paramyrothecium foliicola]|nr:hypothetical protein HJFPF1_02349 [Paramyrothecium foliicola]